MLLWAATGPTLDTSATTNAAACLIEMCIANSRSVPERAPPYPILDCPAGPHEHDQRPMPVMTASVARPPNVGAAISPDRRAYRLSSIDMVRGLVIVIMAIDHVRDFFLAGAQQDPMADPNVALSLFATRWITHFCAPVFVLLAGVSAGLMTARRSPADLGRLLFTRGLWLIFVEWFVISTLSTFSPAGITE